MFELPFVAGTGTVEATLTELAQAALRYYQYGVTHPDQADRLPVGVTDNEPNSNCHDLAAVAGYLSLEQRFGRIHPAVSPDNAASLLLGALVSRALELEKDPSAHGPDQDFVSGVVEILLGGIDNSGRLTQQNARGFRGTG